MAIIRIPDENRTLHKVAEIKAYLASINIDYERWEAGQPVAPDAPPEEILAAYSAEIQVLKQQGGYVTALHCSWQGLISYPSLQGPTDGDRSGGG